MGWGEIAGTIAGAYFGDAKTGAKLGDAAEKAVSGSGDKDDKNAGNNKKAKSQEIPVVQLAPSSGSGTQTLSKTEIAALLLKAVEAGNMDADAATQAAAASGLKGKSLDKFADKAAAREEAQPKQVVIAMPDPARLMGAMLNMQG